MFRPALFVLCAVALTALISNAQAFDSPAPIDFERQIAPLLNSRCMECHNANEKAGGLDLSNVDGLEKGGDSGAIVDRERPLESLILERTSRGEMPPKKQGKSRKLADTERQALKAWIEAGTPWPAGRRLDPFERTGESHGGRDWWSLQPLKRVDVPKSSRVDSDSNPIDAFIRVKLDEARWVAAPQAGRRTLIKRLANDVVGLPPTFDEVETFVNDPDPKAYEHLVDRYLNSSHFGERWGRYWLDLVRFAESSGYERDQPKPFAWKYRDWVIDAINRDMPLTQFVTEQLAGDEIENRSEASLIATGFLRLGTWNDEPNDPQEYKYERLEDMVHVTSTAFLAMTVKCARCHDHKFDPIRQDDYYKMAAAFWPGPIEPAAREWLGGPDPKILPGEFLGWTDISRDPPPLYLLKKGDIHRPGPAIEAGPPSMVAQLDQAFAKPSPQARTTERRLQLARWIANPQNPLTARVWVNRIWQHHFGQGIVRSPDNFGFNGEKPTHPELLAWLARQLINDGWKSKPIHRLILLSETYKQASIHPSQVDYERTDAGNRLYWRAERRRRDAESIRDALLTASGKLDLRKIGGPSFYPTIAADALEGLSTKSNAWNPSPVDDQNRRAVYIFAKRGLLSPIMTAFDFPDTTLPCGQRDVTLVPPQALALLNNDFVHEQSNALAQAILKDTNADIDRRELVNRAWKRVLSRLPNPNELTQSLEHLDKIEAYVVKAVDKQAIALASLCHVLMNANEMLFVD